LFFQQRAQNIYLCLFHYNKYLVVDTGTSPVRGKTIIDVSNQKEILSFTTLDDAYGWISNNEIVFTDLQKVSEPRPYGGGEGCGIAIINLKGEKKSFKFDFSLRIL